MLTGYFDETNTSQDQKVPAVAGYLASTFQWSRFGEQWDKLLRQWGIPVDPKCGVRLAHRNKLQHLQGDFKGWRVRDREEFLRRAYLIIRRNTKMPIGNAVTRADFETIALKRMQRVMGGVYGWCAYTCLHQVKQYCDRVNHREPVKLVFEMGAPGWGQVNHMFQYLSDKQELLEFYRIDSISFVTKKTIQLQAADFLAYDLGRFFLDYRIGRTRPEVSEYLRALVGPRKPEDDCVRFWDAKSLRGHAQALTDAGLFQG